MNYGSPVIRAVRQRRRFRNPVRRTFICAHLENSENVGVIEGCCRLRFLLKSPDPMVSSLMVRDSRNNPGFPPGHHIQVFNGLPVVQTKARAW